MSILIGLMSTAVGLSLLCLSIVIRLYITVEAMKQSTHSVQYVDPFKELLEDTKDIDKENAAFLAKESKKLEEDAEFYSDMKRA